MGGKRVGQHCRFLLCHLECPIDAQAWSPLPFIHRIEGFGIGESAMSMVGALLHHSLSQTTTSRPHPSAFANSKSHNLQV